MARVIVDGSLRIYDHVEERGLVFLNLRKGRLVLTAGAYVGLIPMNPSLSVDISPRLPVSNLSRVLELAHAPLGRLRGASRTYQTTQLAEANILAFIAANFVDAVRAIQVRGLRKVFAAETQTTSYPRGRILVGESRTRCQFRGRASSVVAERYNQTANTQENGIIKTALRVCLETLSSATGGDARLLSDLAECHRSMPKEVAEMTKIGPVNRKSWSESSQPDPSRPDYTRALGIAHLVLDAKGILLDKSGIHRHLDSFVLNFESIVEEYLRNAFRDWAPSGVIVKDGNKDGKRPLFTNRPTGRSAQPDIVIRKPPAQTIICEVKYKDKLGRDDINQAVTYAVSFGTSRVILLHISSPESRHGLYEIGSVGSIKVDGYAFDLNAKDLKDEEREMCRAVVGPA